jgi:hypothetical protein
MQGSIGRLVFDVGDERHERGVAFENHIEFAHFVARQAVGAVGIEMCGGIHVLIDSANHLGGALQIPEPICRVRGAKLGGIPVDESLKDAIDMGPNSRAVGGPVVICRARQQRG